MRVTLTRELANASAMDAANAQMRRAGRTAWSEDDYALVVQTMNALWPLEREYPWATPEQIAQMRAALA